MSTDRTTHATSEPAREPAVAAAGVARAAYAPPRLRSLGSVRDLTLALSGMPGEIPSGMRAM